MKYFLIPISLAIALAYGAREVTKVVASRQLERVRLAQIAELMKNVESGAIDKEQAIKLDANLTEIDEMKRRVMVAKGMGVGLAVGLVGGIGISVWMAIAKRNGLKRNDPT